MHYFTGCLHWHGKSSHRLEHFEIWVQLVCDFMETEQGFQSLHNCAALEGSSWSKRFQCIFRRSNVLEMERTWIKKVPIFTSSHFNLVFTRWDGLKYSDQIREWGSRLELEKFINCGRLYPVRRGGKLVVCRNSSPSEAFEPPWNSSKCIRFAGLGHKVSLISA